MVKHIINGQKRYPTTDNINVLQGGMENEGGKPPWLTDGKMFLQEIDRLDCVVGMSVTSQTLKPLLFLLPLALSNFRPFDRT